MISQEIFAGKLPNLMALGEGQFIPFLAKRLADAQIIWVNHRWFFEMGIDSYGEVGFAAVCDWLIDELGFAVPQAEDPNGLFRDEEKVFLADRYGGEGVVRNGGSARCGICGLFSIKGIGKTPLASPDSDFFHSHGGMAIEEAIREAIQAEVAAAEFPFGAVPVVAIIRSGQLTYWRTPDGVLPEPRALMVRPAFVRPAHFLRPIFFRPTWSGDHLRDVGRVKKAIQAAMSEGSPREALGMHSFSLREFAERIAEQIAFGWIHRLSHGAYVLSNMTTNGELADFGAFSALPTWGAAVSVKGFAPFGGGRDQFKNMLADLVWSLKKYGAQEQAEAVPADLYEVSDSAFQRRAQTEMCRVFGIRDGSIEWRELAEFVVAFSRYAANQQRSEYKIFTQTIDNANSWFDLTLRRRWRCPEDAAQERGSAEERLLELCHNAWRRAGIAFAESALRRFITPRPALFKAELKKRIEEATRHLIDIAAPHVIAEVALLVDQIVCEGRRHWPQLEKDLVILGQTQTALCSAVWCSNASGEMQAVVLSAYQAEGGCYLFDGKRVDLDEDTQGPVEKGAKVGEVFRVGEDYFGQELTARLGKTEVVIPAMQRFVGLPDGSRLRSVCAKRMTCAGAATH